IGVGISSGANFIGCVKIAEQLPDGAVLVTVFSDDNKKYLSTDYAKEEPVKEGYYSSRVRLTEVIAHR
ncbi:MAG: cysteine synthase, partial [Oscillospiraceae bacterium]|nr:cysteine synthase [Oscillospiraceae bacterium]